ncbi:RDD family protein [Halosolutus gelatinilyticus]|uniref:RDD family protein n=1 Tax=Halosolutus gelatinilyticus TaxID=2931975 RepID=UPI001FF4E8D3|nr:RDD family protein [Halosolutus gelatinilyticus]
MFVLVLIMLISLFVIGIGASAGAGGGAGRMQGAEALGGLIGLVLAVAYYAGSEAKWGQTPGKMLVGIRVVRTDGRDCTAGEAVLRNITKILGGAALLSIIVAIVLILATDENQRLGDIIGGTTVVKA